MKKLIIISLAATAMLSCKEFKDIGPHGSTAIPGKVTVTEVVNDYGKSIIYYNLPDDSNLHYIKAIYSPRPGETAEANASFMTDSLIVDGFKEAKDYTVELVSVSYGNTWSDPVKVTVSPSTPPYQLCVEEMNLTECFGGLTVATENPTKANLDFIVYKMGEDGTWKDVDTRYSGFLSAGRMLFRPLSKLRSVTDGVIPANLWSRTSHPGLRQNWTNRRLKP